MKNLEVSTEVAKRSEVLNNMSNATLNNLIDFAEFDSSWKLKNIEEKKALIVDAYLDLYTSEYEEKSLDKLDEKMLEDNFVNLIDEIIEDVINEL